MMIALIRALALTFVLTSTAAACETEVQTEERAAVSGYYFMERVELKGSTYVFYGGPDTYIAFQFIDGCAIAYWYGLDHLLELDD